MYRGNPRDAPSSEFVRVKKLCSTLKEGASPIEPLRVNLLQRGDFGFLDLMPSKGKTNRKKEQEAPLSLLPDAPGTEKEGEKRRRDPDPKRISVIVQVILKRRPGPREARRQSCRGGRKGSSRRTL